MSAAIRVPRLALAVVLLAGCGGATPSTDISRASRLVQEPTSHASESPGSAAQSASVLIDPGSVAPEAALEPLWEARGDIASGASLAQPAVDPEGRIWVGVFDEDVFWIFDREGAFIERWDAGTKTAYQGHFGGVAFGRDGRIYVADAANARVRMFDADRRYVGEWGSFGQARDQFVTPNAIATDADGNVYVHDDANGAVKTFDPDGRSLSLFLAADSYPSILPTGGGDVLLVTAEQLLTEYDANGDLIRAIDVSRLVDFPVGIAQDDVGNMWLGSNHQTSGGAEPDRLLQFGPTGTLLHDWEGTPVDGLALDPAGDRLYVTMYGRATLMAYKVTTE